MKRPWAVVLLAVACEHSEPFVVGALDPLGPFSLESVRRLTFNPSEDREPFVMGDSVVVYTSLDPGRADRDRCLGFVPVLGGTVRRMVCPGGVEADTVLDAWKSAAVSQNGRLAFVHERGDPISFSPRSRTLAVADVAVPGGITFEANVLFDLYGERINAVRRVLWEGEHRLTFVAGLETLPRIGTARDTVFAAVGLAALDLADASVRTIPGGEGVFAYAHAPDERFWVVASEDSTILLALAPDGSRSAIGTFSGAVVDVAAVAGSPTAAILGGTAVEWLDPVSGQVVGALAAPGVVQRLSAVEGQRRVVAEVESGGSRDLWLVTIP